MRDTPSKVSSLDALEEIVVNASAEFQSLTERIFQTIQAEGIFPKHGGVAADYTLKTDDLPEPLRPLGRFLIEGTRIVDEGLGLLSMALSLLTGVEANDSAVLREAAEGVAEHLENFDALVRKYNLSSEHKDAAKLCELRALLTTVVEATMAYAEIESPSAKEVPVSGGEPPAAGL